MKQDIANPTALRVYSNVRQDDTPDDSLVASVREHGILTPVLVTESDEDGVYILLAGHRRVRAAVVAGLREIPVMVYEGAHDRSLIQLAENSHRVDLSTWETVDALAAVRAGTPTAAICASVSCSKSHLSNLLAVSKLDPGQRAQIDQVELDRDKPIGLADRIALAGMRSDEERFRSAIDRLREGMPVREPKVLEALPDPEPGADPTTEAKLTRKTVRAVHAQLASGTRADRAIAAVIAWAIGAGDPPARVVVALAALDAEGTVE